MLAALTRMSDEDLLNVLAYQVNEYKRGFVRHVQRSNNFFLFYAWDVTQRLRK